MNKPLVIYHANCTDGFGAAFASWLVLGSQAEYLPMNYGDKAQLDMIAMRSSFENRDIYILDFSFSREVMDQVFSCAQLVVWLDHHKTAFEMWCGEIPEGGSWIEDVNFMDGRHIIVLDNNKSGALLAWEYFNPNVPAPMLIKHIDDRDRWQFKLAGTKEFHAALRSYEPWNFEQWFEWQLHEPGTSSFYWEMIHSGEAILRAHNQNVQSVVKQKRECQILKSDIENGNVIFYVDAIGLVVNCPPNLASDVGHELANRSGTFGLCWYLGQGGKAKCSLRSNGDYDVSAIAKSFGGGGHKNAAGFETDIFTLLGWMK